jgi:altronate dehydratase small subunit
MKAVTPDPLSSDQGYTDRRVLLLRPLDNCLIACTAIAAGTRLRLDDGEITVVQGVALGHKIARHALRIGDKVLRCDAVIGSVTCDVAPGEHLHLHNLKSDYLPTYTLADGGRFFDGSTSPKDSA